MSVSPGEENKPTTTTTTVAEDENVANIPSHTILEQEQQPQPQQQEEDVAAVDSTDNIPPAIESTEEINANQLDEKQMEEIVSLNQQDGNGESLLQLVSPSALNDNQSDIPVQEDNEQQQQQQQEEAASEVVNEAPIANSNDLPEEPVVDANEEQQEPTIEAKDLPELSEQNVNQFVEEQNTETNHVAPESSSLPNDEINGLSEASTEQGSSEVASASIINNNNVEQQEQQQPEEVKEKEQQKEEEEEEVDIQLDIPDMPESTEQVQEEDKMDVDIPQETPVAFQPSASENRQFEEEEIKQELGEDEELKNIQQDDPSFDGNYNVNDYNKSDDELEKSVLMNDDNMDLDSKQSEEVASTEVPTATEPIVDQPQEAAVIQPPPQIPTEVPMDSANVGLKVEKQEEPKPIAADPIVPESELITAASNSTINTPASEIVKPTPVLAESKVVTNSNNDNISNVVEEEAEEEEENNEDEPEEPAREKPVYKQTHLIIIPSYASWFNMKKIHKIEKESLPEFFDTTHPSKSPKLYVNYRNFMINSYRLNPNEFLTLTSCRRNLVGDVGTLMRVHRFLNKWGLINYQVKPQFKPGYALEKMPNGQPVDLPYTGDYHVKFDTPRGLFPFDTSRIPIERIDVKKLKSLVEGDVNSTVDQNGNNTEHTTNSNNKKHSLLDETPQQVKEEEQQEQQPPRKKRNDGWSDAEYDALVNAVKLFKNDWYKIANAVGSNKTPQQCILKFLQLPLEDKFNPIKDDDSASINLLKYAPHYPVSSIDNPVLSNLAFMTKLVDSSVAKAASEAASKAMDACIEKKVAQVYNSNKDETQEKQESSNGAMEREPTTEDAIATTFGILGGRSHLFSSFEEREMHKISSSIVNHEISKIETKLNKVEELEKIYERERQHLAKQQEELFIDRIALTKSTIGVIRKLEEAIKLVEGSGNEAVGNLLNDAKSLLYKPTRQALEETDAAKGTSNTALNTDQGSDVQDDNMIPLSLKAPQSFKIWAP